MRWFYILSVYVLAFTYSKIQFNSFLPEQKLQVATRSPASGKELSCKEIIAQFYPTQSKTFIEQRLEANTTFHAFFRAFAPLFYREILNDKDLLKTFKPLKKFQGTIAGDLHLENFGFVVDDKGKAFFILNDFDDVTKGEVYQDLIRHFLSAKIVDKDISWNKYFKAYQKGLSNEAHSYSYYIEKGLDNVNDEVEKVLKEYVGQDEPFKFIKRKTPGRDTDATELKALTKALKEKFPKFEIYDHYVRIKVDGGSAGLKRFQVLGRMRKQDKLQWFDIKESAISGYDKANGSNQLSFEERITSLKDHLYFNKMNKSVNTVSIDGHPYSVRAVDQFASSVKLDEIPEDDYADIALDQAYVIGKMHRSSLAQEVASYLKSWNEIDSSEIEKRLDDLKDRLKKLYKETK